MYYYENTCFENDLLYIAHYHDSQVGPRSRVGKPARDESLVLTFPVIQRRLLRSVSAIGTAGGGWARSRVRSFTAMALVLTLKILKKKSK